MSSRDSVTSPPEKKRTRNREQPTPDKDRARAYKARKRETHRPVSIFIQTEMKDALVKLCELKGLTQAELLEKLIEAEARNNGVL
jgi:hypothetical protein